MIFLYEVRWHRQGRTTNLSLIIVTVVRRKCQIFLTSTCCVWLIHGRPPHIQPGLRTSDMSATVTRRPAMAQSHTQHLRHDDVRMAKIKPCQLPVVVVSRTKIERRGELRVRKRPHWGLRAPDRPSQWALRAGQHVRSTGPASLPEMTRSCCPRRQDAEFATLCNHHRIAPWDVGTNG